MENHIQKITDDKKNIDFNEYKYYISKQLKYFLQFNNQYIEKELPFSYIKPKSFFEKHKRSIIKMCLFFKKCNKINDIDYIKFFTLIAKYHEKDVDNLFANEKTIKSYLEHIQIKKQREKIYSYFIKSVNNIVNDCNQLHFTNVIDYIRYIITNKLIGSYLISGKISIYYFAAIPNFTKVIEKMDILSRDEFNILYTRFDKYNEDIIQAFIQMKNIKINAISYTNNILVNSQNSII